MFRFRFRVSVTVMVNNRDGAMLRDTKCKG